MSKIAELKQSLRETRKPDDVVMAILATTQDDSIVKDPTRIHSALYQLSTKNLWKNHLEEFFFDVSGISPFSDLLDQVLSRLETSCILSTPNPRYEEYHLQKEFLSRALDKFNEEEKVSLKEMAREFEVMLSLQ